MKVVIYDKKRKEYVIRLDKRLISGSLIYETTPDINKAKVVNENAIDLAKVARELNYDDDTLIYKEATHEAEVNQASNDIVAMINKYAWKYDDINDTKDLMIKIFDAFEKNYDIDAYSWKYEIDEVLKEADDFWND